MKLHRALVGIGLAAGLAVPAVYLLRRTPKPSSVTAATDVCARFGQPGDRRTYGLSFSTGIENSPGKPEVATTVAGRWSATVVVSEGDACKLAFRLHDAEIGGVGASATDQAEIAALRKHLGEPFFAAYRRDGLVSALYFPPSLAPGARNLLQMITTSALFVPAVPDRDQWTSNERDGAGVYLASYTRFDGHRIRKTKLRYLPSPTAGSAPVVTLPVTVLDSETIFDLDPAGHIAGLESRERIAIGDQASANARLGARFAMTLSHATVDRVPDQVPDLRRIFGTFTAFDVVTHRPSDEQLQSRRDRERCQGANFADIAKDLAAPSRTAEHMERMAAWLRIHPDSAGELDAFIRRQDEASRYFLRALAQVGDGDLPSRLCGYVGADDLALPTRDAALAAATEVRAPGPRLLACVRQSLDGREGESRKAAYLAIGALARNARARRSQDAESLSTALLEAYRHASTDDERLRILAGMGNDGGARVRSTVEAALAAGAPRVREAALHALRLQEQAEERLIASLRADPDINVRRAALFAMGFRPAAPFIAEVSRVALEEADDGLRAKAVAFLAGAAKQAPAARPPLARVAEHERRPNIRKLAVDALAALSRP